MKCSSDAHSPTLSDSGRFQVLLATVQSLQGLSPEMPGRHRNPFWIPFFSAGLGSLLLPQRDIESSGFITLLRPKSCCLQRIWSFSCKIQEESTRELGWCRASPPFCPSRLLPAAPAIQTHLKDHIGSALMTCACCMRLHGSCLEPSYSGSGEEARRAAL